MKWANGMLKPVYISHEKEVCYLRGSLNSCSAGQESHCCSGPSLIIKSCPPPHTMHLIFSILTNKRTQWTAIKYQSKFNLWQVSNLVHVVAPDCSPWGVHLNKWTQVLHTDPGLARWTPRGSHCHAGTGVWYSSWIAFYGFCLIVLDVIVAKHIEYNSKYGFLFWNKNLFW